MSQVMQKSMAGVLRRSTDVDRAFEGVPGMLARLGNGSAATVLGAELADAIRQILPLAAAGKQASRETWDGILAGAVTDTQEAGEVLFAFWDKCINAVSYLYNAACLLDKQGVSVPDLPRLEEAVAKARRERDESHRTWPWFSEADRAEVMAEIERGDAVPVEEILRELQSRLAQNASQANR
jgi:hypothetical protein